MRFTVVLLLITACPVALAAEPFCTTGKAHPIDIRFDRELEKADGVTAAIREAQGNAYNAWDKELNAQYKKLMAVLAPRDRDALKQAQRAWLSFVSAEEKLWWSGSLYGSGGTLGPVEVSGVGTSMVRDRTCQLIQYRERIELDR